jgi:hypothetical protein
MPNEIIIDMHKKMGAVLENFIEIMFHFWIPNLHQATGFEKNEGIDHAKICFANPNGKISLRMNC